MKEREPERNESTDEAVWLDLVSRLQNMPADETHGGRDAPNPPRTRTVDAPDTRPGADNGGDTDTEGDVDGTADPRTGDSRPGGASPSPPADPAGTGGPGAGESVPRGPIPRSAAERTRAIFENQPFRAAPPRGPRDYDEPEELESEGEFVPPEPPPFSTGEPLVVLAWIGAVGGPILLLVFAMFWRGAPLAVILGVIALFVAAAGYLIFRLPQHRDDDGAAV